MPTAMTWVPGIGVRDSDAFFVQFTFLTGHKLDFLAQTASAAASSAANQGVGTVTVPALSAGATGNLTITNSLIATTSLIFLTLRRGTTTPGAGAVATVLCQARAPGSGSVVVDVTNLGSAATLSTDYELWFLIVN